MPDLSCTCRRSGPVEYREIDTACPLHGALTCCVCGMNLLYLHEGTEGGLKRTPYCPVHGTRGTQHLREALEFGGRS